MTSEADEPLEEFYGDDWTAENADPADPADPAASRAPTPPSPQRRMPVAGALMAGIALGLRDVFEPKHQDRIAVEQPAPGQPLEPQRYEVRLDPTNPSSSVAIYRPWVEDPREAGTGTGSAAGGDPDDQA